MDRLMPDAEKVKAAVPVEPKPLYTLSEREVAVVKDKMFEIKEAARVHAKVTAELQGMLAVLRPEGSTSFDSDTLTFFA